MFVHAITLVSALAVSAVAGPPNNRSVVRRASYGYEADNYNNDIEQSRFRRHRYRSKQFLPSEDDSGSVQEDSNGAAAAEGGTHCVVWGDWNFDGKTFQTKQDADAFFKSKKKTELAVVQYHGLVQANRFMSKRMTRVDWTKMKGWCDSHSSGGAAEQISEDEPAPRQMEEEAPRHVPRERIARRAQTEDVETHRHVQRGALNARTNSRKEKHGGTFKRKNREEPQTDLQGSFFQSSPSSSSSDFHDSSYSSPPVFSSNTYDRGFSSMGSRSAASHAPSVAAALETKGSSLSGKISILENELESAAKKASSLLQGIGVASSAESLMSRHTMDQNGAAPTGGKLKARLGDLEESATRIQEKAALLETEFFGAATASETSMRFRGETGQSIKKMIDGMAGQVDEIKNRISALDSAPLLDEVSKLEQNSAHLGSDASRVFKSFGMDNMIPPPLSPNPNQALKDRLRALSGYMENLQRGAGALDNELLGGAFQDQAASYGGSQMSIKNQIVSLGEKMQSLEGRISNLANSPIMSDVSKMENAMMTLSSRTAGIAKNVGLNGQTPRISLAQQGSPFKARIDALGDSIRNMEGITEALEQELSGNVGALPNQPQSNSPVAKVKSLEMQIENLNGRISSLEQQV